MRVDQSCGVRGSWSRTLRRSEEDSVARLNTMSMTSGPGFASSVQLCGSVVWFAGEFQCEWPVHGDQSVTGNGAFDWRGIVHNHGVAGGGCEFQSSAKRSAKL